MSLEWREIRLTKKEDYCCLVVKLCPTLCDPMDCSTLGLPVPHYFPEFAHIHVH